MFYSRACLSTVCMPGAHGGQTRKLHFLETELQMVVSRYGCWELA